MIRNLGHRPDRNSLKWMGMITLLGLAFCLSLMFGSRPLTLTEIHASIFDGPSEGLDLVDEILKQRMIRTLFCILCGCALSISGVLIQTITRNPLADPSLVGTNAGASLAVILGIVMGKMTHPLAFITLAMVGALGASLLVFFLTDIARGPMSSLRLILAGMAVNTMIQSLVMAILLPRIQTMDAFRFWQVGSVGHGSLESSKIILWVIGVNVLLILIISPSLEILSLGDEMAQGLGVKVKQIKLVTLAIAMSLSAVVTAFAGPIGFIALIASHISRLILGPQIRPLIIFSGLSGAFILTVADLSGRILARPGELEVGLMTAFIGGPLLIYLIVRGKRQ